MPQVPSSHQYPDHYEESKARQDYFGEKPNFRILWAKEVDDFSENLGDDVVFVHLQIV